MFFSAAQIRERSRENRRNLVRLDEALTASRESELAKRASETVVSVGRARVELGWLARNNPVELEHLMDSCPPDHKDFWAITLVYERYEKRIRNSVSKHRSDRRRDTLAGLAAVGRAAAVC